MKIIDTHAHIFPPRIEHTASTAIQNFYGAQEMLHIGSPEALLESGKKSGLTNYVVFSTATTPHQVTRINDFIMEQTKLHPEFIGVGTMHRDFEDYEAEVQRIYDGGMRGIKLHPDFQEFNIDDEKLLPVYEALQDRNMFIITHSGDYRYNYSHPERVAHVARMFPRMRIVAAHFGGWMQWDVARRVLPELENVYIDTSSTCGFGGASPVLAGLKAFDRAHIFFGCDFPMWDHGEEIEKLRPLVNDDSLFEDILYNNFAKFYSIYDISQL